MDAADPLHPRQLIPELCRLFYSLGWVTGTGGGVSIKESATQDIYIAPSGVQKERIQPEDMFVYTLAGDEKCAPPPNKGYKASQCTASTPRALAPAHHDAAGTPLFFAAYRHCSAGAVIHTHSQHAVRATLVSGDVFQITHQEMIKGIRAGTNGERLRYFDTLTVPIIENTTHEADLTSHMERAIAAYPDACAVLVRRHGVYVWGKDWVEAKTMAGAARSMCVRSRLVDTRRVLRLLVRDGGVHEAAGHGPCAAARGPRPTGAFGAGARTKAPQIPMNTFSIGLLESARA